MAEKPKFANSDWHGSVVYQIYPRSFKDSNGDGIGDLRGVIEKLDHINGHVNSLGADAIWLSPFYASPMADFGYDVADYREVDPLFGSLEDFKLLMAEAEKRGIKIILDLVPNHTSIEHEWFKRSRANRDNDHSDWYVWRDGRWPDPNQPGSMLPPNNWRDALTGGSAWEWDEARQQFYLHSFDKSQPDLNWSNPAVREAMKDVMRFWLDMGVDGFRVDAVDWMAKDPLLSDDDPNPSYKEGESGRYESLAHNNSKGFPVLYAYLSEMAEVLKEDRYRDKQRFMITETHQPRDNPLPGYMMFYVGMDPEVAAPFNFEGLHLPWRAQSWRHFLKAFHTALNSFTPNCVASYAFGNHDEPRIVSRLGEKAARAAAVMQMSLPGIIFVYNGEEIGMHDVTIPPDKVKDPAAQGGLFGGRDQQRTPMQWDSTKNAGFSTAGETWLPVADDFDKNNVASEARDPHSFLALYKKLIRTRRSHQVLKFGELEVIETSNPNVLGYARRDESEDMFVTLVNFSDKKAKFVLDAALKGLVVSSLPDSSLGGMTNSTGELLPFEAALFEAQRDT